MEPVPRQIARWAGPKEGVTYQTTVPNGVANHHVFDLLPSQGNLVLQGIDVNIPASGSGGTSPFFVVEVSFNETGGPFYTVLCGQVSANTGLYFPWRGEMELGSSSVMVITSIVGQWDIVAWGFLTVDSFS
jgi:hypothetical protein